MRSVAAGPVALKRLVAEAVNARLRRVRSLRSALMADRAGLRQVLMAGTETAKAMAAETLENVRRLMHTVY
jgi:tryptophanyl-tRNA synthetase